jgi:hypothetical protein
MFDFNELTKFLQPKQFKVADASNNIAPVKLPQRKSNISFNDSVRELCDNCIDAGATKIDIFLLENNLFILDNGNGMDLRDLDDAFVTNSSTKQNNKNLIGKWGVGLKQSIIQFNKDKDDAVCHILSGTMSERSKRPVYAYGEFSPSVINKNIEQFGVNGWKIPNSIDLYNSNENDKTKLQSSLMNRFYELIFEDGEFHSGTIVLIKNASVPELIHNNLSNTAESLNVHLGESYFNILKRRQLKIFIHDTLKNTVAEVTGNDFLLRDIPGTDIFSQWEYRRDDVSTPLKFTVVITPKETKKTIETYLPINNDNNGIYLVCNEVVVARATKNHIVTPDIKKNYIQLLQDNGLTKKKNITRKKIWFNINDSYSSTLRVAIECDGNWQKYIQLDQEKISFTFHDDLSAELANLMFELDKAMQESNRKTSDDVRVPVVNDDVDVAPVEEKAPVKPSPKPKASKPIEEDVVVVLETTPEPIEEIKPEIKTPVITIDRVINTDELWTEFTKTLILEKDKYLQPLLKDFSDEIREKLLSL